jgi:hypothetical protein
MIYFRYPIFFFLIFFLNITCDQVDRERLTDFETVDREQLLADIEYLSSDELEGRLPGTEGNRKAQDFIEQRFEEYNLSAFDGTYRQLFDHTNPRTNVTFTDAVNLIGFIEGTENNDRYIALTAHYDHLGVQNGEIYNGADDNASGTSGLLAAIRYFSQHQPENSILFIALDAEEQGLGGARHFVEHPLVPLDQIVMNVNMDMISTNFDDELYAVGTYHYPFLKPFVEEASADADIDVLFGYDSDEWEQDWTMASDHGAFHEKGIPFIYFGVEDHPHYHQPTDTFENINPEFFVNAVGTIINVLSHLDKNLDEIAQESGRF